MSSPYISFLIPVYNTGKYLGKCLDTVINQTCGDIEIVIVNDGSTDDSADIIEQYRNRDSRIKVITQPENKGLLRGRIDAIAAAAGQYIVHVDSDDYVELDYAEKIRKYTKDFQYDIIAFQPHMEFASFLQKIKTLLIWRSSNKNYFPVPCSLKSEKEISMAFLNYDITVECWGKAVRTVLARKFAAEFNSFNLNLTFYEDCIQTTFYVFHAQNYLAVTDKVYHYHFCGGVTGINFSNAAVFEKRLLGYNMVRKYLEPYINSRITPFETYQQFRLLRALFFDLGDDIFNHISRIGSEKKPEAYQLYFDCMGKDIFMDIINRSIIYLPNDLSLIHFLSYVNRFLMIYLKRNLKRIFSK